MSGSGKPDESTVYAKIHPSIGNRAANGSDTEPHIQHYSLESALICNRRLRDILYALRYMSRPKSTPKPPTARNHYKCKSLS